MKIFIKSLLIIFLSCYASYAQTGTFIDRELPTDLRIASFNVWVNTIFPDENLIQAEKFVRIVQALDVDIWHLQEIHNTPADVIELLNEIDPGPWYAHKGRGTVIASKFPLSMQEVSIDETSDRPPSIALVDLPGNRDFYFINHHFVSGVVKFEQRQRNADATIRWLRELELPPGTPIAIVGDMNNVREDPIINTLVTGNILNENIYGPDFAPDWDGSSFTNAHPLMNGVGPEDYTFRWDMAKAQIDHIIYSDSALDEGNKFLLNTVDMSPAELIATGLQANDVTIDSNGIIFDHIPVITDFRIFDFAESDFNFDRVVDNEDLLWWESNYGNENINGSNFLIWQQQQAMSPLVGISIPEPTTLYLSLIILLIRGQRTNNE